MTPKQELLSGKPFSRLVFLKKISQRKWLFKCDCGIEKAIDYHAVLRETTRSCGCLSRNTRKYANCLGIKFNHWEVIGPSVKGVGTRKERRTSRKWLCKCVCGVERFISSTRIKSASTYSCGCLNSPGGKKTHATPAVVNELVGWYLYGASQRDLPFELTHEQCYSLFAKNCVYCGTPPTTVKKHYKGAFLYNGIDRVDNSLGYTLANSVTCCKACNLAKHKMSLGDFKAWIQRLANHQYGE